MPPHPTAHLYIHPFNTIPACKGAEGELRGKPVAGPVKAGVVFHGTGIVYLYHWLEIKTAIFHKVCENFHQSSKRKPTGANDASTNRTRQLILYSFHCCHVCVNEKQKYSCQGWNRKYFFSTRDLLVSATVLYNYLEVNPQVFLYNLHHFFVAILL